MIAFYKRCIFCGKELPPPDKRGRGEHVIPDLIYGSMKIKDLCRNCNNMLGTEVDHKILEDPRIIGAILKLDIKELKDKIIEKGTTVGKDTIDGHEVKYKYKDGKFRMIPSVIEPDGLEHSETDAISVLKNIARKNINPLWEKKELEFLIDNHVSKEYEKIKTGGSLNLPPFNRVLRKRQATIEKTTFKRSNEAAYRLVAKIVYEMCWYALDLEMQDSLSDDIIYFGKLAYGEADYEEYRIIYRPVREPLEPDFYHLTQFHFERGYVLVDVDFFKSVNFRVMLRANKPFALPKIEESEFEGIGIFMSFDPDKEKRKGCAYKFVNEPKWAEYDLPGL
jgi:hypothetical protein